MPAKKSDLRPVIVTTKHRGVFYGLTDAGPGQDPIQLSGARMCIYWGTTRGFMELAHTGPTSSSKISAPADMEVREITSVVEVSPEAFAKWKEVR